MNEKIKDDHYYLEEKTIQYAGETMINLAPKDNCKKPCDNCNCGKKENAK